MKSDILQLYNEIYHRDAVKEYEDLPLSLRTLVRHWQHGYRILGGGTHGYSRQIASLLFIIWEKEEEREVCR